MRKAIVVPVILLACAQVAAAQSIHPRLKSKEVTVRSVAVVPPKVDDSKGKSDKYRAEELANRLAESVSSALKSKGREVPEALKDEKQIAALQEMYESVCKKVEGNPKGVGKAAFTLGPDVAKQAEAAKVDALVFVRADAAFDEKVSASADASSFSITSMPLNKVKARFAMVDAKTGDVLLYFTADGKGNNPDTFASLEKGVAAGLRTLPD